MIALRVSRTGVGGSRKRHSGTLRMPLLLLLLRSDHDEGRSVSRMLLRLVSRRRWWWVPLRGGKWRRGSERVSGGRRLHVELGLGRVRCGGDGGMWTVVGMT